MPDIKYYWHLVAEWRAKLPSENFITSLDKPLEGITGGATCGATDEMAARRIVEGTHRLATEDEIAKFHADQKERDHQCAVLEFRKKQEKGGGVSVTIDPETAQKHGILPPLPLEKTSAPEPRKGK